jgi:hypothetical protein
MSDWSAATDPIIEEPSPPASEVYWGWVAAISGDGLVMCVADHYYVVSANVEGRIHTYDLIADVWVHRAHYIDFTRVITSRDRCQFGNAMSLNGDGSVVAIAAHGEPITDVGGWWNGAVYVYTSGGGAWSLREKISPAEVDIADDSAYGDALALDTTGDILVVVAPWLAYDSYDDLGRIYTYDWSGSAYIARSNLGPVAGDDGLDFGRDLAISPDGEVLVALDASAGPRQYKTYDHVAGSWIERAEVTDVQPQFVSGPFSISEDNTTMLMGRSDFSSPYNTGYIVLFYWIAGQGWVESLEARFLQPINYSRWGGIVSASHDLSTVITTSSVSGGGITPYLVWIYNLSYSGPSGNCYWVEEHGAKETCAS